MLMCTQKKNLGAKGKRFLISVTVSGSSGPIRIVADEEDLVGEVVKSVLKAYARQGRLPVLGSDSNNFALYSPFVGAEEDLNPGDTIGSAGARSFVLFKKPQTVSWSTSAVDGGKPFVKMSKRVKSWLKKKPLKSRAIFPLH